jgi:hypothetical protein
MGKRSRHIVVIWNLAGEGEVFGKEVVNQSEKIPPGILKRSHNGPFDNKLTERSNCYEKEKYGHPLSCASYAACYLCGLRINSQA